MLSIYGLHLATFSAVFVAKGKNKVQGSKALAWARGTEAAHLVRGVVIKKGFISPKCGMYMWTMT